MHNYDIPITSRSHLPRELLEFQLAPETIARDAFLLNIASVAALAWIAYDMSLNINREIKLVWKRWKSPKGRHSRRLYVIVRYFSVVNLAWYVGVNTSVGLNHDFCRAWYYIVLVNTTIITLLPDVMLLIRLNAVYAWNIRTLMFSIFLFLLQMTTSLVVGFLSVSSAQFTLNNPFPVSGCPVALSSTVSRFTLVAWIPSILAQATYLGLMLNTLAHLIRSLDVGLTPAAKLAPAFPLSPRLASPSPPSQANVPGASRVTSHISTSTHRSISFSPLASGSGSTMTAQDSRSTSLLPPHLFPTSKSAFISLTTTGTVSQPQTDTDCSMHDINTRSSVNMATSLAVGHGSRTAVNCTDADDTENPFPSVSTLLPASVPASPLHSPSPSSLSAKKQSRLQRPYLDSSNGVKTDESSLSRPASARVFIQASPKHYEPQKTQADLSNAPRDYRRPDEKDTNYTLSMPALFSVFSCKALKQVQKLVPTMMIFVRHGGWYFSLGILAKVANAVVVTTQTGPLQSLAIPFMMALYPILVTRIYLSMVQYLHFGVFMKKPRLLASYEGEDFSSGFDANEDSYQDGGYNDEDEDIDMDDYLINEDVEMAEEVEERLTLGRLRFDRSRYDRGSGMPGGVKSGTKESGRQNPDTRNNQYMRGPRLGRITFAVRESLSTSSMLDLGFRDEEF